VRWPFYPPSPLPKKDIAATTLDNTVTCTRAAPKLMPLILLCWPTTSEANVVYMAVEVEPSRQYSVKFCCRATDDSRGAVWQNGVWHGSAYETKVCNWIPPCGKNCTHWHSPTLWVARFSSGDSDVKDKPRTGRPCTAVTPRNEERLHQLIRANRRITTRELGTNHQLWPLHRDAD